MPNEQTINFPGMERMEHYSVHNEKENGIWEEQHITKTKAAIVQISHKSEIKRFSNMVRIYTQKDSLSGHHLEENLS